MNVSGYTHQCSNLLLNSFHAPQYASKWLQASSLEGRYSQFFFYISNLFLVTPDWTLGSFFIIPSWNALLKQLLLKEAAQNLSTSFPGYMTCRKRDFRETRRMYQGVIKWMMEFLGMLCISIRKFRGWRTLQTEFPGWCFFIFGISGVFFLSLRNFWGEFWQLTEFQGVSSLINIISSTPPVWIFTGKAHYGFPTQFWK